MSVKNKIALTPPSEDAAHLYLRILGALWFSFVALNAWSFDNEMDTSGSSLITNTYSVGYRMGRLDSYKKYGNYGFRTGTGDILLGVNSVASPDKPGKKKLNPFYFSSVLGGAVDDALNANLGNYVVVKYEQLQVNNLSIELYSTDYRIVSVDPVNTALNPDRCDNPGPAGWKSEGAHVGRIVKVSRKGTAFKTYEAIVQMGTSGAQFQEVSVSNEEMAKCMYKWLASGRKARISFNQAYIPINIVQDSSYEAVKVEPVDTNELDN